jgi:PPP family 3-phenylpropionic acid transporter
MFRTYYFIAFFSGGIFLPYMPLWAEARGIQGIGLGVLCALGPFMSVLSPVVFGIIADKFRLRASLLKVACFGGATAMGGLTLTALLETNMPIPLIFFFIWIYSIFKSPVITIADVAVMEGKQSAYGTVRLFGSLGFLASAGLGGLFMDPSSRVQLPAAVFIALGCAVVIAFKLPSKPITAIGRVSGETRKLLRNPKFRLFLGIVFLWIFSHSVYDVCISLHLRSLGASGTLVGAFWVTGTLFEIVLMTQSRRLFLRFNPIHMLRFGIAVTVLRWAAVFAFSSLPLLLALQPLHAFTFALVWLSALETVRRSAPASVLATTQGVFAAVIATGAGLSMLLWGTLFHRIGGHAVFGLAALSATAVFFVSLRLKKFAA